MKLMNKLGFLSALVLLSAICSQVAAQSVSVSPSRLYFKELPGGYKSQKIRITNNGSKAETFQVTFSDFSSGGNQGKTQVAKQGDNVRGCSQWLSASPGFFELAPGVTQDVDVLIQVPNLAEANNARWAVASVKISKEKSGSSEKGSDVTGMQILQSFQFLIHIFQTPPTVSLKALDVLSFKDLTAVSDSVQVLGMEVENVGETILDCASYIDVVNIQTGASNRYKNKGFTILPEGKRLVKFNIPAELSKGKYSVLGVVDYGSDSDLAGAELMIEVKK